MAMFVECHWAGCGLRRSSWTRLLCIFTNLRALIKAISGCYAASIAWVCVPAFSSPCARAGFSITRDSDAVPCTRLAPLKVNPHLCWGVWPQLQLLAGVGALFLPPTDFGGTRPRRAGSRDAHLHLLCYGITYQRLCRTPIAA